MALTPLPPAPDPNNPAGFAAAADLFVAALKNMVTEINAQGSTPVGVTPNFQVTLSAGQTITTGVATQVNFDTEAFDVGSIYDSVTNHQCNMTIAGKYQFDAQIHITATSITSIEIAIENSGGAKIARSSNNLSGADASVSLGALIQSAGGTQTARVFVTVVATGTITIAAANSSFSAFFVAP